MVDGGHRDVVGARPPPLPLTAVPIPQLQGLESQMSLKPQPDFQVQIKPARFCFPARGGGVGTKSPCFPLCHLHTHLTPQTLSWDPPMSGPAPCRVLLHKPLRTGLLSQLVWIFDSSAWFYFPFFSSFTIIIFFHPRSGKKKIAGREEG